MTKREEASRHIKNGLSPSRTAAEMKERGVKIREYLLVQIAEGELLKTEVVRSIEPKKRSAYEEYIKAHEPQEYWTIINGGKDNSFDETDFRLYVDCRESLGADLYMYISKMEVFLHKEIRRALIAEFGKDEQEWWRIGIPEQIRLACVSSRETDRYPPGDPYAYTTFIHLSKIIDKNWMIFSHIFPAQYASDKKHLTKTFERLNSIRNAVMHPVKNFPFTYDDFDFVFEAFEVLGNPNKWRAQSE